MTVVVRIGDVAYGTSKKCGSNALRESGQIVDAVPDVLFIRHPIDRLASAWAFFRNDFTGPCLETFIDKVLDGWGDEHWRAQFELWSEWRALVKFERFGEFISIHTHKSEWKPSITYRRHELDQFYRDDFLLYEAAR